MKKLMYGVVSGVTALGMAVPAFAEGWAPTVTLDTAPITTVATAVVAALAAVWAIRKVIKLMNRS